MTLVKGIRPKGSKPRKINTKPDQILWTKHFKVGYILERIRSFDFDPKGLDISIAYNLDGKYIGRNQDAQFLIIKKGIKPETFGDRKVCSIGFCEKEQKWYGWSHRAIYGFKIGDVVKKGHTTSAYLKVGFKAETLEDAKKMAIAHARRVG